MATKRKTSTRKTTSRTGAAKPSTPRKASGSNAASDKAATGTSSRKAATAKAASAARAAVTKAVAEKAKPEEAKVPTKAAEQKSTGTAPAPAPSNQPATQPLSQPQGVTTPSVALTKRALVERVAARTGLRKGQARPVVEAMLAELGEALAREEILKLQPLGVMRVTRVKENDAANVLVCKLRRKKVEKGGDDPLAEAAE